MTLITTNNRGYFKAGDWQDPSYMDLTLNLEITKYPFIKERIGSEATEEVHKLSDFSEKDQGSFRSLLKFLWAARVSWGYCGICWDNGVWATGGIKDRIPKLTEELTLAYKGEGRVKNPFCTWVNAIGSNGGHIQQGIKPSAGWDVA